MAKIEDLKNLDLKKVKPAELKSTIEKILEDYQNEEDKAGFEKEAKKNIDELYQLVQTASPDAIQKTSTKSDSKGERYVTKDGFVWILISKAEAAKHFKEGKEVFGFMRKEEAEALIETAKDLNDFDEFVIEGKKKRGGFGKIVRAAIDQLTVLLDNYEGDDLEGHLENTIHGLNKTLLSDGVDARIAHEVNESLKSFFSFEEQIEQNQKLRHGDVVQSDIPIRKKAVSIVNQLLKELGVSTKSKTKSSKSTLSRDLVREVIQELVDIAIDLDGEEESIVSGTYLHLEDSLEIEDNQKFEDDVKKEATEMESWVEDISDLKARKQVIASINKLLKALGTALLKTPEAKDKEKDEKKAKSKKVLEKVKEYDADIEACRAVIREFNKKKKESQPPKPKPTRLTKLKNLAVSIVKLTPPAIEADEKVQEGNRKGVEMILNHFMPLWGMNQVKQAKSSTEKELDKIEDKVEEKEQKEYAQRWKSELPHTDVIIAYEKKHNNHILEEVALEVVDRIGEAIKLYKEDKTKAFKFLHDKFNQNQLNEYLPKYILDELKEENKKK